MASTQPESRTWTLQQIFCRECEWDLSAVARPFFPSHLFLWSHGAFRPTEATFFFFVIDNTFKFLWRSCGWCSENRPSSAIFGIFKEQRDSVAQQFGRVVGSHCSTVCCLQTRQLPLVDAVREKQPIVVCFSPVSQPCV